MDLIIYTPHPSLDEVCVIQRCEWCQISGGIAVGFLLVDQKKEKAFHMIYHEADSEKSSASTDLYHMVALRGSQVKVCALYIR